MKNAKRFMPWIPEMYLIVSVSYYWMLTATFLNPIAAILLAVLALQVVRKNAVSGMVISMLFLLINLYMVLALLSELNQFPTFNDRAKEMLLFGSTYLGLNIILAIAMLIKWGKKLSAAPGTFDAEPA